MPQRRHRRARSVATFSVLLRLIPLAGFDVFADAQHDPTAAERDTLAADSAELAFPEAQPSEPAATAETPASPGAGETALPTPELLPVEPLPPEPTPTVAESTLGTDPDAPAEATAPGAELETAGEGPPEPLPATFGVMRNDDVVEMANAGFGERTIIAAIEANPTAFDVSPRVLVALKRAGVPEAVIETMLAIETEKQSAVAITVVEQPAPPVQPTPPSAVPPGMSPEALARLSEAIERLAVQSSAPDEPPAEAKQEEEPGLPITPRVWLVDVNGRAPFPASAAQVAYTDLRRLGSTSFKTLQGLASKALAFANPALSSGLSGLFGGDDDETTAVWALLGPASTRSLRPGVVFEVDFASIPGIDPAEYRPAIVQLVPTSDNYRLVGAVKTTTSNPGVPNGPIIEETLPADVVPLARGRFRVTLGSEAAPGEYALVLRPIMQQRARDRRRNENSLGALLGGASKDVLYLTWDFAIRA